MLTYKLLKNHAGILLVGDYESLRCLHDVLHDVNERSPLIEDPEENGLMALAFDARKAYEQQRETLKPPVGYEEIGPRYGVEILWPVILVQQRLFRVSLAYMDHDKQHQAMAYALEALIEPALKEDFGSDADAIIACWQRLDPAVMGFMDALDPRGGLFSSWNKAVRKRRLAALLDSFTYVSNTEIFKSPDAVTLDEIEAWSDKEWPDPKW